MGTQLKRFIRGIFWTVLATYFWYTNAQNHAAGIVGIIQDIFVILSVVAALFYYITLIVDFFQILRHRSK